MKKSILVGSAAILISMASLAQINEPGLNRMDTVKIDHPQQTHPDGVMMTDATMKLVKEGKVTPMTEEITMSNGTTVLVDGTIVLQDKTRTTLKEGQHMDMNGAITEIKDSKGN
jgi:hypothetical protein